MAKKKTIPRTRSKVAQLLLPISKELGIHLRYLTLVKRDAAKQERRALQQLKTDACFVAEIRNALAVEHGVELDSTCKTGQLLRDWEDELMLKAGFKDRKALRKYFNRHVGAYLWKP